MPSRVEALNDPINTFEGTEAKAKYSEIKRSFTGTKEQDGIEPPPFESRTSSASIPMTQETQGSAVTTSSSPSTGFAAGFGNSSLRHFNWM